jgi:outer membrane protein
MKKALVLIAVFAAASGLWCEQLTRYAVVDLLRIMQSFYRDSKAMRDFDERQRTVQAELDKMQAEVKDLQQKKVEAQARNDSAAALDLGTQIQKKTDFIKEYYKVKTEELESQKSKLFESDAMAQEIYKVIRQVAEGEGYTMVMDYKRATELRLLIWYSPTMDITDKVIESLTKAPR